MNIRLGVYTFAMILTPALPPVAAWGQSAPATPAATPAAAAPAAAAPAAAGQSAPAPAEANGFDYKPEGRRDPFVSLVRRGTETARTTASARGAGLGGLETSEVTLKGTVQSREGYVAMLQGSDSKTYIVRVGDRLLDGAVRAINANAVVILQQVNDPLSLEKQREVRKTIRSADEAQ
jgi:Tfp pilus assembly protein PilP